MKLISWNVNGIRACCTKGFEERFQELDADISPSLKDKLQDAKIHSDIMGSDHCPVELLLEMGE